MVFLMWRGSTVGGLLAPSRLPRDRLGDPPTHANGSYTSTSREDAFSDIGVDLSRIIAIYHLYLVARSSCRPQVGEKEITKSHLGLGLWP
jgi:hypothetical protein